MIVSKNYLGSINHTLLTIEAVKNRGIEVLGILYNGANESHMRALIEIQSGIKEIGSIQEASEVNTACVRQEAERMRQSLQKHFSW
jgi:dethiobiotin synthetase